MSDTSKAPEIKVRRLLWVGPATLATAVVAVLVVQSVAAALVNPTSKGFGPLRSMEPAIVTIVCVIAAVAVFAVVAKEAATPLRTYRRLALVILLLSFGPDLFLATTAAPGINLWPLAMIFMLMHIVVWAIVILMLTRLTIVVRHATIEERDSRRE